MNDLRVLQRIAGHGRATLNEAADLCSDTPRDMQGRLQRLQRKGWLQVDKGQWTATERGLSAALDPAAREGFG